MATVSATQPEGIRILGPEVPGYAEILTPDAMKFVGTLVTIFEHRRRELHRLIRFLILNRDPIQEIAILIPVGILIPQRPAIRPLRQRTIRSVGCWIIFI